MYSPGDGELEAATPTRLPDLGRGRPSIRCDLLSHMALESHIADGNSLPGDAARKRAASWRDSAEPASGV
jgi:hypothetical protein